MSKTPEGKPKVRQLTGADSVRIERLGDVAGEHVSDVEIVRLAMLTQGENPAKSNRVKEILDMPVREYLAYTEHVREQLKEGPEPQYNADDSATVGEYTLRPLKGRDLRLLANDPVACLPRLTGLSEDELKALPIGVYSKLVTAVAFLGGKSL